MAPGAPATTTLPNLYMFAGAVRARTYHVYVRRNHARTYNYEGVGGVQRSIPLTHSPSPHPPPSPPSPPPCPLPNMHMSAGALPGNIIDMSAGGGGGPDAPPPPVSMKPAAAMCCFVYVGERTRKQTTKFDEMSYGVFCWGKHFDETNYVFSGGGEQKQMICLGRVTLSRFPGKSFGGTNGEPGVPAG